MKLNEKQSIKSANKTKFYIKSHSILNFVTGKLHIASQNFRHFRQYRLYDFIQMSKVAK